MKLAPAALFVAAAAAFPAIAVAQTTSALTIGEIESITVDSPCADRWCGGTITIGGKTILIPRNLLIDLPANRLTLVDLFSEAPPACLAAGQSGLAAADSCAGGRGATATIAANRNTCGDTIAGDIFLEKGPVSISGKVTFIDHTQGYFRMNGTLGADAGLLVRLNDPTSRHTIQQGIGCAGGPNCSPDTRFGNDPDNYTLVFPTGYPVCIPSTVTGGSRVAGSDAAGTGDPFCPQTNRGADPVADSRRFAPLRVGDDVTVDGAPETVGGVRFFSAHSMLVKDKLTTRDDPTQPDYITLFEVEIDAPSFENERARALIIGFSTLPDSPVDLFSLRVDPTDNQNHEDPLASTVNNPDTINQGIGAGAGGMFKVNYDVDFLVGVDPRRSPCTNLAAAGFANACPNGGTLADELSILSPNPREIIGRTRRSSPVAPANFPRDIRGVVTQFGEYLTPAGVGHPEFEEIDLGRMARPFFFSGVPWNLDRRLGPGGCDENEGCEDTPQPLDPFPFEGLDPREQANIPQGAENRPLTFFTFPGGVKTSHVLDWPPDDPCALTPNPPPQALNDSATTPAGAAVTVAVLANDADPNGQIVPASVTVIAQPANGSAVVNVDGSITYTPDAGFSGIDTFTYRLTDAQGAPSNTGLVTVTVQSPPPPPLPVAQLSPVSVGFPATDLGLTSASRNVTLSNSGTLPLLVSGVGVEGTNVSDFPITTNGCAGRTLAPGETCTVAMRFTPTAPGPRSARLSFTNNADGSPHRVNVSGTGRAPAVALSPTSVGFGSLAVGATSSSRTIAVRNTGDATMRIDGITLAGQHPADFAITANTCGATLAPAAQCAVQVRFRPQSGGARSGRVSLASNVIGSPHAVALSGSGLAPAVALAPSSLTFTSPVGITSAPVTVRVTNSGNASLRVFAPSISGLHPLDFFVSSNSCTSSLAPGGSCVIGVRFRARAAGARSAKLVVPTNAPGSPTEAALAGNLSAPVGFR